MKIYGFEFTTDDYRKADKFFKEIRTNNKYFLKKKFIFNKIISLLMAKKDDLDNNWEIGKETLEIDENIIFKNKKLYFSNNLLYSECTFGSNIKLVLRFCSDDLQKHILFLQTMSKRQSRVIFLYLKKWKHKKIKKGLRKSIDIYIISDFEVNDSIVTPYRYSLSPLDALEKFFWM